MGSFNVRCRITDIPIEIGEAVVAIDISKLDSFFQEFAVSNFYKNYKIYYGFYADYGEICDENNKNYPIQDRYDKNNIIFIHREVWDEIQEWAKNNDYKYFEDQYDYNKKVNEVFKKINKGIDLVAFEDVIHFVALIDFCSQAGINLQAKPLMGGQQIFPDIYKKRAKMIDRIAKTKKE